MAKTPPFSRDFIARLSKSFPTPFHIYDEKPLRENVRELRRAFAWNPGFREYFAVKAAPNPYLMKILHEEGLGMDCSSLAELELSAFCGIGGEEIMFTSNNTPAGEYARAKELGAIINLDDITHLEYLERHVGLPAGICFRLNPGSDLGGSKIIGAPEEAKFGLTRPQLAEAYSAARAKGVTRFGLHTMPISNELNHEYFVSGVRLLLDIVAELKRDLSIEIEFINMGGGIGIPYRPEQEAFAMHALSTELEKLFAAFAADNGGKTPSLFMECGRYITGPYGYLVTQAIHKKDIFRNYIGVDASMADLMRPALYEAYHHITVSGKENAPADKVYDVVGSLCENNDKFAVQRPLPAIETGDFLVIHDTGAHGHAMGFNYNGKLRSAELLLREDGSVIQIRRAETLDDHFRTLDLYGLPRFK